MRIFYYVSSVGVNKSRLSIINNCVLVCNLNMRILYMSANVAHINASCKGIFYMSSVLVCKRDKYCVIVFWPAVKASSLCLLNWFVGIKLDLTFRFTLSSPFQNHHLLPVRCMNENPLYLRHIYENPGRGTCPPQAQSGGDVSLHGIVQTQKKRKIRYPL